MQSSYFPLQRLINYGLSQSFDKVLFNQVLRIEMKSRPSRRRNSPKSPKGDLRNSSLMKDQDHPFQPQHSTQRGHEEHIPYQSIKNSIPTVNQQHPPSMEMRNMAPMHGSFHNPAFPTDQIRPPGNQYQGAPNIPMPNINMFPQNPPSAPPPPMYPQNPPQNFTPNPLNVPPQQYGLAPNPMNMSGLPPPPLAPNPMNTQPLDPVMAAAGQNFFQQLGGFNTFYYNALDPNLALKKNAPVAVESSKHWPVLVGNILLIAGFVVMAIGMGKFLEIGTAIGVAGGGLVVYLILAVFCSAIRKYIFNLKKLSDYESLYNKMRQGRSYFIFSIECYHYKTTTVRTKKGTSTRRKKIVTHTARTEFNPTRVDDDSGEISALKVFTSYAFVHYLKRFYFADPGSEGRFISAFNRFVSSNRRDTHQDYRYTFEIAGYEEEVGFSQSGEGQHSKVLFILFTLLGVAYPYSMYFENNVSRFEIKILKKLMV